jgi:hypothetical protein
MIELMKMDMGGCAAVFGAAKALAQIQPQVREEKSKHFPFPLCTTFCVNSV